MQYVRPWRSVVVRSAALGTLALGILACAGAPPSRPAPGGRDGGPARGSGNANSDLTVMYDRSGLMAVSSPVAFVGRFAFFGGAYADSTLTLMTLSLPTRSLTFTRDAGHFRAAYSIIAELRSPSGTRSVIDEAQTVRVVSYQETQGNDESIIFQKYFYSVPGSYQIFVTLRDQGGARSGTYENDFLVPDARARGISSVLPVYEGEPRQALQALPRVTATPRATAVLGRDTMFVAYVETYGRDNTRPIHYALRGADGGILLSDSVVLAGTEQISGGMVQIPVSAVGIGAARLHAWIPGTRDTVQTPLFASFGPDLPVTSFNDMLNYLRFFVNPERLAPLREAPASSKPRIWGVFLSETDPLPATPQHEALLEYFERVRRANENYREEITLGWMTDRGEVLVTLGEPDQIGLGGSNDPRARNRAIIWEYQRHSLQVVFQDRTGLGRFVLTPSSRTEFNAVARRVRAR